MSENKALKPWERKLLELYEEARGQRSHAPENDAATKSKVNEGATRQ